MSWSGPAEPTATRETGVLVTGATGFLGSRLVRRLDFLTHSRVYDVTKARRLLGFAAIDLPTGTARTMSWYRQQGLLPAAA
jgi:nucleoside-diphosphate-sugar epimerase